jgi:hypothetical protein
MPRKWQEIVQDWPTLVAGRGYDARVDEVGGVDGPPGIRVVL